MLVSARACSPDVASLYGSTRACAPRGQAGANQEVRWGSAVLRGRVGMVSEGLSLAAVTDPRSEIAGVLPTQRDGKRLVRESAWG